MTGSRFAFPRSPRIWPVVAALVLYGALWVGYRQDWGWLHTFDWSLLDAAHDVGVEHPGWVTFWAAVSFALGPIPLRLLGMLVAVIALMRRDKRMALLLLACAPLNGYVTTLAKGLADRPRPASALVFAPQTSFPSGHALEAIATVLALLAFLLPMLDSRVWRTVAVATGLLAVVLVGISRVALNVHNPSDVIAGWALGYAYFAVCVWILRPMPAGVGRRRVTTA
ncbi:phosphatase PAP2 family protein [Mycobacterium sp.]|uniref:phosphatase PAP2 family protein n=1 Tax=Mycobacterium sp. TaxID=1785 RepID=UPI003A891F3F